MTTPDNLLQSLEHLSAPQLRRLLTEQLTKQKLGLYWESSAIERDAALNANIVLPRLSEADSHGLDSLGEVVDFDDLARLRQWMRDSAPIAN
jgi:adenine-specific DNA-methyltransferase